jgi:hypothetical protein
LGEEAAAEKDEEHPRRRRTKRTFRVPRTEAEVNFATADIPDGEFDNLYLVRYKKKKAIVKKMKYGSASGGSAVMQ